MNGHISEGENETHALGKKAHSIFVYIIIERDRARDRQKGLANTGAVQRDRRIDGSGHYGESPSAKVQYRDKIVAHTQIKGKFSTQRGSIVTHSNQFVLVSGYLCVLHLQGNSPSCWEIQGNYMVISFSSKRKKGKLSHTGMQIKFYCDWNVYNNSSRAAFNSTI